MFVEYAKESPEDLLIRITRPQPRARIRHAPRAADALVPQRVVLASATRRARRSRQVADSAGPRRRPGRPPAAGRPATSTATGTSRCCSPRTRPTRSGSSASPTGRRTSRTGSTTTSSTAGTDAVNPEKTGTKAAAHYRLTIGPGESRGRQPAAVGCRRPRLPRAATAPAWSLRRRLRRAVRSRRQEADEFYAAIIPPSLGADAANVMRQALAGMLWSKQFYHYDVDKWLEERGADPFKPIAEGRAAQRALAPHVQRRT